MTDRNAHASINSSPATVVPAWMDLYPSMAMVGSPSATTPLDHFRAAVRRDPIAPAIIYFGSVLDYQTIDDQSDRLAHLWLSAGLGGGDRLAIILQNVPQFVISILAAWKIGAVPVSINPMYRTDELRKLFADCRPKALLCHDTDHEIVAAASAAANLQPISVLSTSSREFQDRDDARVLPTRVPSCYPDLLVELAAIDQPKVPRFTPEPEAVGLLLYTSGTTGTAKGAMLKHGSLAFNGDFCRRWIDLDSRTRIFGLAPLFHITGFVCHICAAFAAGAPLILTYRFVAAVAIDAIRALQPSFMIGSITAYIALMQEPSASPGDFGPFRQLYSGGAPIPPSIVVRFHAWCGKHIRSCYGMTETAAPAIFSPPAGAIPVDSVSGTLAIGIPIPGTEAVIVDENRQPLPNGAIGELKLRGPQVMLGYWNRPVETDEVLVDGWIYTGDVGFRDADGWFYLVDRKKDMICAAGFKVWPREVEDVLYTHPDVREAAVIGEPDAYRGETVIAFVSAIAGATLSPEELVAWCHERLAAYKAPRRVTVINDLPKTVSGKIARAALRQTPTHFDPPSERK